MNLGKFSVSLAVKDIRASRAFYEALGFEVYDDHTDENWLIMHQGSTFIGLFQGMFDQNILTFNPDDARRIQKHLKSKDIPILKEADESSTGPASLFLLDPDGNAILIDQHDESYEPTSKQ